MSVVLLKSIPVQPSRFEYLRDGQRMKLEHDEEFGAYFSCTYSLCTCDNRRESRASTFEANCRKGLGKNS